MKKRLSCGALALLLLLCCSLPVSGEDALPNDPLYPYQWTLRAVNYPALQKSGLDGSGVTVAIIDSGFADCGDDLQGIRISPASRNFLGDGTHPEAWNRDQLSHGTFVASRIAACTGNGLLLSSIAPGAELMILRCFSGRNSARLPYDAAFDSGSGSISLTADAIRYAADNGADVINISTGVTNTDPAVLQSAVLYAAEKGCIAIASAGNGGTALYYPAACEKVISVAASTESGAISRLSTRNGFVDIAAPGDNVLGLRVLQTTDAPTEKASLSGTSFATPVISALAALAKQKDPSIDHDCFLTLLAISAESPHKDYSEDFGFGVVNGEKFIKNLEQPASYREHPVKSPSAAPKQSAQPMPFIDIPQDAFYKDAAAWAFYAKPQVSDGIGKALFGPDRSCTRAQVVTFLWRAAGCPAPQTEENPFADVPESAYYRNAVLWAVETAITDGTAPDAFSPDRACTKAHILTFLWRAAGRPGDSGAESGAEWWADALCWAEENGLTQNTPDCGTGEACPRSLVIEYLYRQYKSE